MASELPEGFTSMDEEYPEEREEVMFCFRNGAIEPGIWADSEQESDEESGCWQGFSAYVLINWEREILPDDPDFPIGWRPIKA